MHFHVLVWDTPNKHHEGALCLTKDGAEREAAIESTTPTGKSNGKRVDVKECDLACFGGAVLN